MLNSFLSGPKSEEWEVGRLAKQRGGNGRGAGGKPRARAEPGPWRRRRRQIKRSVREHK